MRFVIALGGNALIQPGQRGTVEEQLKNLNKAVSHIVSLVKKGHKIIITHGNGPQVGNILLQQEATKDVPAMPLYICGAESQGLIGYMIQDALYDKLHKSKLDIPVITIVTRVLVDKNDPGFKEPTKPIGPFYKKKPSQKDWKIIEVPKGFRRVVPSPDPKKIIEEEAVKILSKNSIVVACGGGGVPVIKGPKGYEGVDAVIDKDLASARLASDIKADYLVILTDVSNVYVNYNRPNQEKLGLISLKELKKHQKSGHFPSGSMGPKVEASIRFLEAGGKKVIITDFNLLEKAVSRKAGTVISKV
ncbi:MAG: carbamate kinase [Nanoarchaeota archaeon]|nr:carbamate kinase [Nanoarchaeota archaeon]